MTMVHTCRICKRTFDSLKGLNIHMYSCKRKQSHYNRRVNNSLNVNVACDYDEDVETINCAETLCPEEEMSTDKKFY